MAEGNVIGWTVLFGGGADLRSGRGQIPPTRGINYLNVLLDEWGGVMKRPGTLEVKALGAGGDRIISEFVWERASGPIHVVHLSDGTVRTSPDLVTYTTRLSSISTSVPFCFCGAVGTATDKLYFTNIANGMYGWDGTAGSASAVSGGPAAKFLAWWKDTLWAANTTANPSRAFSSAAGNADSWPALNFVDIARGDGDAIMGLFADPDVLITGKKRRIFAILNPTTFENKNVDPDKGVESHWSFITADDGTYFLSRKGIAKLQLHAPSEFVSRNIEPLFTAQVLNLNLMHLTRSYRHGDRLGWSVVELGESVPTLQIECYPGLPDRPFAFHRGPWQNFATWRTGSTEKLLAGSTKSNKVFEAFGDTGTDDGTAFAGVAESAPINLRKPDIQKYLSNLSVVGRGKVNVSFKKNYRDALVKSIPLTLGGFDSDNWGDENWGAGSWGPSNTYAETIVRPDFYFENVVLEFRDLETDVGSDRVSLADRTYLLGEGRRGAWAVHKADLRCVEMGMIP
jgi:hypothetical protein